MTLSICLFPSAKLISCFSWDGEKHFKDSWCKLSREVYSSHHLALEGLRQPGGNKHQHSLQSMHIMLSTVHRHCHSRDPLEGRIYLDASFSFLTSISLYMIKYNFTYFCKPLDHYFHRTQFKSKLIIIHI